MKRLLPIACLLTACTTPSQKPIQPVFDTLDYSYSYAWQPRRSYSLKIAKDGEAWLAIRARREWEYFQGHLSDESLQILHRQARVLFSSSFPKSFRSSTPDLDCYQLLLTSPKGQRKAFQVSEKSLPPVDSLSFLLQDVQSRTSFRVIKRSIHFESQKGVILPLKTINNVKDYLPPP